MTLSKKRKAFCKRRDDMIEAQFQSFGQKMLLKKVYKQTLKTFGQKDIFAVDLSFVSKNEIQKLNLETRNIDKVTDVLSFPTMDIKNLPIEKDEFEVYDFDEKGHVVLGSIAICLERMKEQAEEFGHSEKRELCFLFVHGLLHILGFDHETGKAEESEMFALQNEILEKLKITR